MDKRPARAASLGGKRFRNLDPLSSFFFLLDLGVSEEKVWDLEFLPNAVIA